MVDLTPLDWCGRLQSPWRGLPGFEKLRRVGNLIMFRYLRDFILYYLHLANCSECKRTRKRSYEDRLDNYWKNPGM